VWLIELELKAKEKYSIDLSYRLLVERACSSNFLEK
jgi:hypothetical protein